MKNRIWIWIALIVLIAVLGWYLYPQLCNECLKVESFKPENIRNFIRGFGPYAFVVFVLLYAVNTVTLLPPIALMSLSAGFLFGPFGGTMAILFGAFCGTTATFFIARYLGGGLVERIAKNKKASEFQEKLGQNGFWVILPIRFIGFPPWEVVNYVSGLSKMSYKDYIFATMIGIFPASFAQAYLSDRVSNFDWKDPTLYIAVGLFIAMMAIPAIILKKRNKGASVSTPASEGELNG